MEKLISKILKLTENIPDNINKPVIDLYWPYNF